MKRVALFWLSDEAWAAIAPHRPQNQAGARRVDDRRVISGILHVLKVGCRWCDCPSEYGPSTTVYNRFNRWSRRGFSYATFEQIAERMAGRAKVPARADLNLDFPLRGFITCGCCDVPLTACWSTSRNDSRHPYYLCQKKGCERYGKSVRRDVIEGEFASLLQAMRPSENLFAMAHHMFRDLWNGPIASRKTPPSRSKPS